MTWPFFLVVVGSLFSCELLTFCVRFMRLSFPTGVLAVCAFSRVHVVACFQC